MKSMKSMKMSRLKDQCNSFNSDVSMSSISSIESLLESRKEDAEKILFNLGFGCIPNDTLLSRIPARFFESPSMAKGINVENFILNNCSPVDQSQSHYRERSFSCGKNQNKPNKEDDEAEKSFSVSNLPEIIAPSPLQRSSLSESILNPINREFLNKQGKDDRQNTGLCGGIKKLVIGEKSYRFENDNDPLAFPKTPSPLPLTPVSNDGDLLPEGKIFINENVNNKLSLDSREHDHKTNRRKLIRQRRISDDIPSTTDWNNDNRLSVNQMKNLTDKEFNEAIIAKICDIDNEDISNNNDNNNNNNNNNTNTNTNNINNTDNTDNDDDLLSKKNAHSQTDNIPSDGDYSHNEIVESALLVAIQSLKLSLEFYKLQSIKLTKISEQRYEEAKSNCNQDDLETLAKLNQLRDNVNQEIVNMNVLLNQHLNKIKGPKSIDETQKFIEAVKKMTEVLKEQKNFLEKTDLNNS